jgi:membrane-bound lytic murein transglycosylase D
MLFPCPPEIEPLRQFWIEIFTERDRNWTVLHDKNDPTIRYETLATGGMSEAVRRDLIRARTRAYTKTLENLALKPPSRWNEEEKRIVALFGDGGGTSRYLDAAGQIRSQRGISESFRDGLIRSGRWKPTIQSIFKTYEIPPELSALPHVESSFNPEALSKAGAAGVWQFTRSTGKRYMKIDRHFDERRDVYISTHAAARYLREAYEKLGSWPLAVTSYNHGVEGMLRARRELATSDIARMIREYDGPYFGFASKNFYAEFLAAVEVSSNPELYFGPIELDPLEEVERFVLPGPVRFAGFCKAFQCSEEELRRLNPALGAAVLQGRVAVPSGAALNLPLGRVPDLLEAYAAIPVHDRRDLADGNEYRVRTGDTLTKIARAHGVSVGALQAANNLGRRTVIRPGQRLTIPASVR